ncbi:MAG: acetoin dehydrogenase [Alphaproteobacteria bacterium RIFOXYD12_FULL_60_8]|nr:MAG: acetoin dehydrogenase [Alphaproteobacteria bacterium RIFOXYD12_FULL_60_8]
MSTPSEKGRLLSYVNALREAVEQEMERDPSVFVIGLDVDDHKAIQGSTKGLVQKFGPERVMATPLSEDAMTGVCIGAAMAGLRPIHVHIRMDFLLLCMNQLINMAAKSHYMYGGRVKVPMVARSMIGKSWGQGAQHSQALHSLFMHIPGLKVVAPATAHDAKGCMIAAIRDDNPVIFVEHRLLYFSESYVPEAPYEVPFGKARVVTKGSDITIVGISNMLLECLRAQELLKEVGVSAEIIDPISLLPLDTDTIAASGAKTGRLLVVDNGWTAAGASAEILAAMAERPAGSRPEVMKRMGYAFTTCPTTPSLEEHFYANPATIAAAAYKMVRPGGPSWTPDPERAKLAYQMQFKGPF